MCSWYFYIVYSKLERKYHMLKKILGLNHVVGEYNRERKNQLSLSFPYLHIVPTIPSVPEQDGKRRNGRFWPILQVHWNHSVGKHIYTVFLCDCSWFPILWIIWQLQKAAQKCSPVWGNAGKNRLSFFWIPQMRIGEHPWGYHTKIYILRGSNRFKEQYNWWKKALNADSLSESFSSERFWVNCAKTILILTQPHFQRTLQNHLEQCGSADL